jgi:hypothetical protein
MNHRIVTVSIVALLLASMLSILSPPAAAQGGGFDSNVVSLVPFNGPQGSTSFLDVTGKTWTVNSGGGGSGVCFGPSPWPPWMDTSTFRFGGASGYFHCVQSYIYTEATSDWNFGTGPFTFDWWMDVPVLPPRSDFVFAYQQFPSIGNSVQVGVLNVDSTVSLALLIYEGGNPTVHFVVPAPGITAGQWSHYALVRSGDVWFWFLDGIQQGNTTSSASWPDFASPIFFGWVDNGDLTAYFDEAHIHSREHRKR